MKGCVEVGPSPTMEPCAQIGAANYDTQSRLECAALCEQLKRQFGDPPKGVEIGTKVPAVENKKSSREVVVYFEKGNKQAEDYAAYIGNNVPIKWDEAALKYIKGE